MESLTLTRIAALVVILYIVQLYFISYWRLRHVPGPVLAKFTDLQRVWWVKSGRAHEYHRDMHAKYGPIVRFGPNMVSVSDPRVIPTIYPSRPGFPKVSDCSGSLLFLSSSHNMVQTANPSTPG